MNGHQNFLVYALSLEKKVKRLLVIKKEAFFVNVHVDLNKVLGHLKAPLGFFVKLLDFQARGELILELKGRGDALQCVKHTSTRSS